MQLVINGRPEEVSKRTTLLEVLLKRKVRPELVAVEINGEVVREKKYAEILLKDGDEVEFLYYMAGG